MLLLGKLVYRHRFAVLLVWALVLAGALPLAPRAPGVLRAGGFAADSETQRAADLYRARFGAYPATLSAVFTSDRLTTADPRYLAGVEQTLAPLRQLPEVAAITTYGANPRQAAADGRTSYAVIALQSIPEDFRAFLPAIQAALQPPPELAVTLTGAPVFYSDIQEVTERDLRRAELISFPFAAVALLLVFGSVVAAAVPGFVGGAAVAATLGLMVLLSRSIDLSIFALNLVTMLGLGLGIDYSLFITSRFREELRWRSVEEALLIAVATAGRAVLFSGLTVLLGLLALTTFRFMALRSLGIAGALVVALSVLAALTLLPALLAVLGPRLDWLPVLRRDWGRSGLWAGLAERVMRRPLAVFVVVLAALVALGLPFLRIQLGAPDASILPPDVQSRRGYDLLRERFGPGEISPHQIVLQADGPVLTPERIAALHEFVRRLEADPEVARVDSLFSLDPRLTTAQYQLLYADPRRADPAVQALVATFVRDDVTLITVTGRHGQTDPAAKALVERIRNTPPPAGMTLLVGGGPASVVDYVNGLYADFPRAVVFVVLATLVVLYRSFRSAVLPLKAVVMNVLSILASFGALVVVFQEGFGGTVLGFEPLGFVEASLPIVLFCVLFGLSMDYEVFLLARVREEWLATGDNAAAVAAGLERSGRIITSAAAIVVLVAGSFVFADIIIPKALGLGTAIAVLLDATVVRALLVPATLRLLGRWNWWPG